MGLTATEIITSHVIPGLGGVIATWLYFTPLFPILRIRKTRNLDNMNAFPMAMQVCNSFSWVCYGMFLRDWYILAPNYFGLILAFFYVFSLYSAAKTTVDTVTDNVTLVHNATKRTSSMKLYKHRKMIEIVILTYVFVVMTTYAIIRIGLNLSEKALTDTMGYCGVICVVIFYASPLSTIVLIIRVKSSRSIYIWLCVANLVCALLWTVYGFFTPSGVNYLLVGPNGAGVVLAIIQIVVWTIYRDTSIVRIENAGLESKCTVAANDLKGKPKDQTCLGNHRTISMDVIRMYNSNEKNDGRNADNSFVVNNNNNNEIPLGNNNNIECPFVSNSNIFSTPVLPNIDSFNNNNRVEITEILFIDNIDKNNKKNVS